MIFALYIIVTLLICICLFLSQIVWQNETYHLENKYPNNKVMQKAKDLKQYISPSADNPVSLEEVVMRTSKKKNYAPLERYGGWINNY